VAGDICTAGKSVEVTRMDEHNINTSGSWSLHSGKSVKVTESDEHIDKNITRNKTLLTGGAAGNKCRRWQ